MFPANKKGGGSSVPSFIFFVVTHLGSEIGSAQHTRLLATSADARLVRKYFSNTKERARDVTVGTQCTSSVPYTYYIV